ncbi:NIL domain-containing protein [Phormidium sp. FACHB-1136]|uniref:NIL domain-containing protein n=1 Tax=Phormidium sp. FACHB-1136 TaxID=2692848 RepID=UPI0016881306|nr:NIL domain-containing protein [Phormidium sp. FACHB-1136]MBD2426060.1 NIL domain-containing protein [Phormidium sp. FACHB-1136]
MALVSPDYSLNALQLQAPESLVQIQVKVRIPKDRHPDPVISNLINRYGLKVNILGALLGANGQEDGWFDLAIEGRAATLHEALLDLVELDADLWFNTEANDGA